MLLSKIYQLQLQLQFAEFFFVFSRSLLYPPGYVKDVMEAEEIIKVISQLTHAISFCRKWVKGLSAFGRP